MLTTADHSKTDMTTDKCLSPEDFCWTSKGTFLNPDQVNLFEQMWRPKNVDSIRAVVFVIHGLNEHSSFFYEDTIVRPLVKIGCLVVTHDHVGHGRSGGNRKVVGNVNNLARDVIMHLEKVRSHQSIPEEVPTFLYGHSLGGLIACLVSLERPEMISGMVLEAPALSVNDKAGSSGLFFLMARILSTVLPSVVLRKPVFTNLSRNPLIVQEARDDTLRNKDGLTLGTAVNISNAVFSTRPRLKDIQTPFFVAHGLKDSIVSVTASEGLQREATVADKSLHIYKDSFHLLRGDSEDVGEDFKGRIIQWIDCRIK